MQILINPIEEIETACKTANFFTGFALAVTYFDYEANHILGMFFQDRISRNTIERLSLALKIKIVFGLDLIEEKAYHKILEIIDTRNRLIHPTDEMDKEGRSHYIFLRFRLNEKEKSSLLGFKECYSSLVQAYSGLFEKKLRGSDEVKPL
jgi:hypothetical protein